MKPSAVLRAIFITLFLISGGERAPAQGRATTFERYTLDDGLSNNVVTAFTQDRFGFVWIGTEDGLNRFDGYTFTAFKHDPRLPWSIQSNFVTGLCRDSSGDLWIGTSVGLERFDPAAGRFVHYDRDSDSTFAVGGSPRALSVDRGGVLWIVIPFSGVVRYDQRSRHVDRFRHDPADPSSIPVDSVVCICTARDGRVWLSGYSRSLTALDPASGTFTSYAFPSGSRGALQRTPVTSITEDSYGNLWYTTFGEGIGRFSPATGTFQTFRNNPHDPRSLGDDETGTSLVDAEGRLWIATFAHGIDCYDAVQNAFLHFPHDPTNTTTVGNSRVYALFEDGRRSLWVGTWQGGISVFHPWRRKFLQIRRIPGRPVSLSGDTVLALCEDSKGRLWVGTENGGLNRYDSARAGFVHFLHDGGNPGSIGENTVTAVKEDRRGRLWVATASSGLDRFDEERGAFLHYRHRAGDRTSLSSDRLMTLCEDHEGQLWVGTYEGILDRFDAASGRFQAFTVRESGESAPSTHEIQSIVEDTRGNLWIGTFGSGLYRLDAGRRTFTSFLQRPGAHRSVPADGILSLAVDDGGDLWIGTFGHGLFRYLQVKDSVEEYTELDGLPSNYIKGVIPDGRGNFWLSSIKGLTRFSVASRAFRNYDLADGVQANEFRTGAFFRGSSGFLYFGGVRGFNMFKPDEIRDNPQGPVVVLTAFKIFDEPLRMSLPLADVEEVNLSYAQNYFSLEFVALDFTASRKNQYAYMLEGFDRAWIACGTRRFANYTHLAGGSYLFRVKGSNNDGIWNETGTSIRIIVNPPFWETWWFRIPLALALAGIPLLVYRSRVRRSLAIERTRSHIARDLHDELSATLSGINFFTQAILRDGENAISQKSQRFLSLIHESTASLQESISDIIWSVNPGQDQWDQIAAKFRRYASDLFDSKSIAYRFDLPVDMPRRPVPMERKRNVWLMYKEIVTNAAKHSGCAHVVIGLRFLTEKEAELEVRDDGRGFDGEHAGGGNGVRNIRSRARLIGADARLTTEAGKGTRWNLRFPA